MKVAIKYPTFPLLVVLTCVLLATTNGQTGQCIYPACNFNRQTTPRRYHRLLTFLCRRCCGDISRLNQATQQLRSNPPSLTLSPALREAAENIRDVFQTVLNFGGNREGIAQELEFAKDELQEALETLENGLGRTVFDALDNAIEGTINTAARATNIAEGLNNGWNLRAVIELLEAITEEGGYALEILDMIATILLL